MSFVPGSKYDVTMLVASLIPARPLPWAIAVVDAARMSAALMNNFFFVINCFFDVVFLCLRDWIVPSAVNTFVLFDWMDLVVWLHFPNRNVFPSCLPFFKLYIIPDVELVQIVGY